MEGHISVSGSLGEAIAILKDQNWRRIVFGRQRSVLGPIASLKDQI